MNPQQVAAANDRASDRAWDAQNDLADRAERIHDTTAWHPQDFDELENMVDAISDHLPVNLWTTLDLLKHGDPLIREQAIADLTAASDAAIWQRCYDIAGDV